MKKYSEWIKTIACLCILAVIVSCLNGCQPAKIEAKDLMEGVEALDVERDAASVEEAFRKAQYHFAAEILKGSIAGNDTENKNTLVSPLSVQLALAMTANGASGETLKEMENVLGSGMSVEELNRNLYAYVQGLPSEKDYKLEIANSIWFRDDTDLTVKQEFLQNNATWYQAQAYKRAFDESTATEMNKWVSLHTDGMIDKIIDKIEADNMLFLLNALVFDAKWHKPYETSDVFTSTFYGFGGEEEVKLMSSEENLYVGNDLCDGFVRPYKDKKYSFVALLPKEDGKEAFDAFVDSLTGESLQVLLDGKKKASIDCKLPKFSYDYAIKMNDVLKAMGMSAAFSGATADFSRMADCGAGNLYIDQVLHKTYIEVDENGTKAAAVTNVGMSAESCPMYEYIIRLDRPFVYMIVDEEANLPIFIGTVMSINP